jgi:hypothetical protein
MPSYAFFWKKESGVKKTSIGAGLPDSDYR